MQGFIRSAVVLGVILCSAMAAEELYLFGGGGIAVLPDSDIVSETGESAVFGYNAGYLFGGGVGYVLDEFRIEAEIIQSRNSVDAMRFGGETADAGGSVKMLAFLLNICWDYHTGSEWTPYVGAGIGTANVKMDGVTNEDANLTVADGKDNALVHQLKAGVQWALGQQLQATVGYRYLRTQKLSYQDLASGHVFENDGLQHHMIEAGVQYRFTLR